MRSIPLLIALFSTLTFAQETPPELSKILAENIQWRVVDSLEKWPNALSSRDVDQLQQFIKTQNDHWLTTTAAKRLLRKHDPALYPASPTQLAVETILLKLRTGKVPFDGNDDLAVELAKLGPDSIPALASLLPLKNHPDLSIARVCVLALARINTPESSAALWTALDTPLESPTLGLICTTLLRQSPTSPQIDKIATVIAAQKPFDQESIIYQVSDDEVPQKTRMTLFGHYDRFVEYGKHAVIRGLKEIDDREAFDQMRAIIRKNDFGFAVAIHRFAQMSAGDPEPTLVEALDAPNASHLESLIVLIQKRNARSAIPKLLALQKRVQEDAGLHCIVSATLASFGVDYEANLKVVHQALGSPPVDNSWNIFRAAGMLHDPVTVERLCKIVSSPRSDSKFALDSLTRISSPAALPTLRRMVERASIMRNDLQPISLEDLSTALSAIATHVEDEDVAADARAIAKIESAVIPYMGQRAMTDDLEKGMDLGDTYDYLRAHPAILTRHLNSLANVETGLLSEPLFKTLSESWNDAYRPALERILTTNKDLAQTDAGQTYFRRAQIARLLSEKTGKPYTYVDVDGKTKSP